MHGHICLRTHVGVRVWVNLLYEYGQSCLSVYVYLYMCLCMCLCVDMYMCMNMIVSCMSICAHIAFICTL